MKRKSSTGCFSAVGPARQPCPAVQGVHPLLVGALQRPPLGLRDRPQRDHGHVQGYGPVSVASLPCASRDTPPVRTRPTASSRRPRAGGRAAEVQGDPLHQPVVLTGVRAPLDDVRLLAPVIPRSKVIGIGKNYADHAAEMGGEAPAEPLMFLKPNTAVIGPGDPIVLPRQSPSVHYEGELAVVIRRICKDVPLERVTDVIYGYTCANDVTARDLQRATASGPGPRGSTRSARSGPWIVTDLDAATSPSTTRRDGEMVQDGRTSQMVHDIAALVVARLGGVHAAARRRHPDRDPRRRRPDRRRPARRGRDRGHRHPVQPRRPPGLTRPAPAPQRPMTDVMGRCAFPGIQRVTDGIQSRPSCRP